MATSSKSEQYRFARVSSCVFLLWNVLGLPFPFGHEFKVRTPFNLPSICRTITAADSWRVEVVEQDRRRTPRFSFIATAEVVVDGSDVHVAAGVSELSLHGCYLDMANPFPLSSQLGIKIFAENEVFQSKGRIIYLHPGIGAGVAFLDVAPEFRAVLESWLDAAEKDTLLPPG